MTLNDKIAEVYRHVDRCHEYAKNQYWGACLLDLELAIETMMKIIVPSNADKGKMTNPYRMRAWQCDGDVSRLKKQAGTWSAKVTVNECGEITEIDLRGSKRIKP